MAPPPVADATSAAVPAAGVVPGRASADAPLRGIVLVLASTVFFAASDVAAKYLTAELPPLMICWIRFAVHAAMALALGLAGSGRAVLVTVRPGMQVLRGIGMVLSAILFITGLTVMPVAEMTAINFVAPVFITALSVVLLSEKVGIRRWTAALVGLAGVLLIIRPGTAAFQPAALFPVASSSVWAFAAIATRILAAHDRPETTLIFSGAVGFGVLTLLLPWTWTPVSWLGLALGVFVGVTSTIGHWMLVWAFRRAPASTLAPFSYTQLVWATALGWWFFATLPDAWTYAGAAVIAASGLYTAHRERVRARLR